MLSDSPSYKQTSSAPIRKVTATGVAGAIVTIVVLLLNRFVLSDQQQIPADITAAITTVISFIIGYLVPPGPNDHIAPS